MAQVELRDIVPLPRSWAAYERCGLVPTERFVEGERVLRLDLRQPDVR